MEDVMNFDMPKAVFCGLALIAAAIFFGPGSVPATAQDGKKPIKVAICDIYGHKCADITDGNKGYFKTLAVQTYRYGDRFPSTP